MSKHSYSTSRFRFPKLSTLEWTALLTLASIVIIAPTAWRLHIKVRHLEKKLRMRTEPKQQLQQEIVRLPHELANLPYAEDAGIVLSVKTVDIPDVVAPYNASLIENEGGYLLFFRYDLLDPSCPKPFYSRIGSAELDSQLNLNPSSIRRIDTQNDYSEDPRVVRLSDQLYLSYNDPSLSVRGGRVMRLGRFDPIRSVVENPQSIDPGLSPVEKNWPPFERVLEDGSLQLQFEYSLNPRILLQLDNIETGRLSPFSHPDSILVEQLEWPTSLGLLRGGAPPRCIGDQFLGFFHSSFRDKNDTLWYVMGAYTFEAKPPFRITAISPQPILFRGIYNSAIINTAMPWKRVIFPAGFALSTQEGREIIHLACGENDSAIKIVTMDKEALLNSLKRIEH